MTRSDSAYVRGDAVASLQWALPGLRQDSNDVALLWRAARAEVALAIVSSEVRSLIDAHYERAIAMTRRAVQLAPNDAEPHYWLAAALGRLALRLTLRAQLSMAGESYKEAERVLAMDSLHAGAHDIIGKLNSEVRKLPWMVRQAAAVFTSLDVARAASWETAELHLKRAIALDPTLFIARSDLAQLYQRMGRPADAAAVVKALEALPARAPADAFLQAEARSRLITGR